MLCDELIAHGAPGNGCDITPVLPRLRQAQKFALNPEFAAVADALAADYTGLVRAFPHCRLPYPEMWIEFAHADRPNFWKSGVQAPDWQARPKRVGFLLTATKENLSAWKAHLFWTHPQHGNSCPVFAMMFDMLDPFTNHKGEMPTVTPTRIVPNVGQHPGWVAASASVREAVVNHTQIAEPDYRLVDLGVPPEHMREFIDTVLQLSRSDWAGEVSYLLAIIGLLNAKNAVETESVDQSRLNRARAKRRQHPLFEHKLLKIARRQRARVYGDNKAPTDHAAMRGHFVRGHWKVRRSGIFFWHPHARGDFKKGYIHKDYELD